MSERNSSGDKDPADTKVATFSDTAILLGIPQERWNDPTVRKFVEFHNRLAELQVDLTNAVAKNSRFLSGSDSSNTLAKQRDLLGQPDMGISLASRYEFAELLLRSAIMVMKEGMGSRPGDNRPYVQEKLNVALRRLGGGYEVVKKAPDSA